MSKSTLPLAILLLAFLACNPSPLPQTPQPLNSTPTTPATLPPTNTPTLTPSPSPTSTPSATNTASPQPTATVTTTEAATATIAPSVIYTPFTPNPVVTMTMTAKQAQIAEYWHIFEEVANRFDLDPDLLAFLGYRESGLNPEAKGRDCELGLMQIHCITWGYLVTKIGIENPDPLNPEHNVLAAGYFLNEIKGDCERWGDPSEGCMLATYACGQSCMAKFYFGGGGSWENSQMAWEVGELFEGMKNNE